MADDAESTRSSAAVTAGDCIVNIDDPCSTTYSRCNVLVSPSDRNGQQIDVPPSPEFELIHHQVEDHPEGYPMLAAFQASEPAFSIYRSFEYLHSRVLLDLQYELSDLEHELRSKDNDDFANSRAQKRLASRKRDDFEAMKEKRNGEHVRTRQQILSEIRTKLVEYDEVLIKARETRTFQRPHNRDYKSVMTWFMNWKPLVRREWLSLRHKKDMLTLRQGREWAGFDGLIELSAKLDYRPLRWILQPRRLSEKAGDKYLHYYDAKRVEAFATLIITIVIFILLVFPVVLMYELTSFGDLQSTFRAIGVLVVFTLLFSAAMSLLTKAKRHELFAASAAYCAVLVVFISNFN